MTGETAECPHCGGQVVYRGFSSLECDGWGCDNLSESLDWARDRAVRVPELWRHRSGAVVWRPEGLSDDLKVLFPQVAELCERYLWSTAETASLASEEFLAMGILMADGSGDTLEDAQRHALEVQE